MGIKGHNFAVESIKRNQHRFGMTLEVPAADEAFFVASTALANNTADADFALAAPVTASDGYVVYPLRPYIVMRNAAAQSATKLPGLVQVNPTFQGADDYLEILIEGELEGVVQSEVVQILATSFTQPTSITRAHVIANKYYSRITRVRHQNKAGTWGTTTAAQISVGTGNCEFGDASVNRTELRSPFRIASPFNSILKRLIWPDDGTSAPAGSAATGNGNVLIDNTVGGGVLRVPGKDCDYTTSAGLFTVQVAGNTLTQVAHGLVPGNALRVRPYADGLPVGLAINTTYYVLAVPTADTLTLHTAGATTTAIDLQVGGPFADTEAIEVMRPTRRNRPARLIWSNGVFAEQ